MKSCLTKKMRLFEDKHLKKEVLFFFSLLCLLPAQKFDRLFKVLDHVLHKMRISHYNNKQNLAQPHSPSHRAPLDHNRLYCHNIVNM